MSSERNNDRTTEHEARTEVSRRRLIQGSGATAAIGGLGLFQHNLNAQSATPAADNATPADDMGGMEMGSGADAEAPTLFFSMFEATTVEALTARIMPGTADDPGAREAGVVFYIDRQLAGANLGYSLKTYTSGPFASAEATGGSVTATSQNNLFDYVFVQDEKVPRYGYQSVITPQDLYRRACLAVNAYANEAFGGNVGDLTEDQQDQLVASLADDSATGFEVPTPAEFFTQLRNDTIEGMFSDPLYGGNRGLVGWKLIGYPGAQVLYLADDLANTEFSREPQSLSQMMSGSES